MYFKIDLNTRLLTDAENIFKYGHKNVIIKNTRWRYFQIMKFTISF